MKTSAAGAAVIAAQEGLFVGPHKDVERATVDAFAAFRKALAADEAHIDAVVTNLKRRASLGPLELTQSQFDALVGLHRDAGIPIKRGRDGGQIVTNKAVVLLSEGKDANPAFSANYRKGSPEHRVDLGRVYAGDYPLERAVEVRMNDGTDQVLHTVSARELAGVKRGFWARLFW